MSDFINTYASVEDFEKRYRPLSADEKLQAEILLADAAVKLRMEFKHSNVKLEPDEDLLEALKIVSCSMVKRVFASPGFQDIMGADVKEFRTDVGQLSETYGFYNPDGQMFIKSEEKRLLGLSGYGRITTISMPVKDY